MRGIALTLAALMALLSAPASAHPHVWVTTRAALVFDGAGRVAAIRHAWTFDESYSAYATQGMVKDGKLDPAKAADLAKLNVDSLADSGFFTTLRAGGAKQTFGEPTDPSVALGPDGLLTLSYLLPLKDAVATRRVLFDVFDPTYFVDFSLAPGDAVTLQGAPTGCAVEIQRPKAQSASADGQGAQGQNVSEAFFQALSASANYRAQFAGKVAVTCP